MANELKNGDILTLRARVIDARDRGRPTLDIGGAQVVIDRPLLETAILGAVLDEGERVDEMGEQEARAAVLARKRDAVIQHVAALAEGHPSTQRAGSGVLGDIAPLDEIQPPAGAPPEMLLDKMDPDRA